MDQRSLHCRRAGAFALYALLSVLVVSASFVVAPSEAARRDAAAPIGQLPPDLAAQADTTFDGFIGIRTDPDPACSLQPVSIRFSACHCHTTLISADFAPDGVPRVRAIIRPDHLCIQCDPISLSVPLGVLAAGHFVMQIERNLTFIYADSSVDSTTSRDFFEFDVRQDCPPPTGILYLDGAFPGQSNGPCPTCPREACPNDSIPLLLLGQFPTPCYRVREVRLLPSPEASPLPRPPLVEVVYARNSCIDIGCPTVVTPWLTRLHLPPLPPSPAGMPYPLHIRGVLEDDCNALPPEPMGEGLFSFVVVESCSTAARPCFVAFFEHGANGCDATFGAGKPAEAKLYIQTPIPLAGLQGELLLDSPALIVTNIETTGVAKGMTLQWTHQGNGAKFVLYAEHGAPIVDSLLMIPPNPVSVLLVSVELNPLVDAPVPRTAYLTGRDFLGSDEVGIGVNACPQPQNVFPLEPWARLCLAAPCDHNADGLADVRDLVLLVRCVQGEGPCPDPISSLDCVPDGHLDLDDVMCCATVVLGGSAPDSLPGRPEPAVTVALEAPAKLEDGTIEVAMQMGGTDFIGAARLELSYPWLRYEVTGIVKPTNSRWLPVSQDQNGKVVLGLIAIQPKVTTEIGHETWVLRLRLRDGQSPGGMVALSSATFAGPDGVGLVTNVVPHSVPLGPTVALELGTPRPNPFVGATTSAIQLDDPAELEVGVFDLAGRRIATLFRGLAPAGISEYRWNGRRDNGEIARSGVYFMRASSGGQVSSKKVLYVPANLRYTQ